MGYGDLNGNESAKGKGFDGNPENAKLGGRPRKSFASITQSLKDKGVQPLTKSSLMEAYAIVFNCTEDELKEISKDKNTPYSLRIIIAELNDKNKKMRALEDYRNYAFGKAKEHSEQTVVDKTVKTEEQLQKEIDELNKLRKKQGGKQ